VYTCIDIHFIDFWKIPAVSTFDVLYVTAVFCNYFNFPLVVLLRATRKSRGDITAEETWCTCLVRVRMYMCACAECSRCTAPSLAALIVYSISRVSFSSLTHIPFPFFLLLRCNQARHTHARVHIRASITCVCLSESGVLDLSRFPADACKSCLQT